MVKTVAIITARGGSKRIPGKKSWCRGAFYHCKKSKFYNSIKKGVSSFIPEDNLLLASIMKSLYYNSEKIGKDRIM
jgi:hypothetical protein